MPLRAAATFIVRCSGESSSDNIVTWGVNPSRQGRGGVLGDYLPLMVMKQKFEKKKNKKLKILNFSLFYLHKSDFLLIFAPEFDSLRQGSQVHPIEIKEPLLGSQSDCTNYKE